jgi:hypothetical protein
MQNTHISDHATPLLHGTQQRPPIKRGNEFGPTFSIFLGNLSWDVTPELVEDMLNDVLGHGLFTQG